MKGIKIILGLLWIAGGMAFGQSAIRHDDRPYPGLGDQFTRSRLSLSERQAFEKRAVQKLYDLGDYLALAATSEYPAPMRTQAVRMATDLFLNGTQPFLSLRADCREDDPAAIAGLLDYLAGLDHSQLSTGISEVKLLSPCVEQSEGVYTGVLGFRIRTEFGGKGRSRCKKERESSIVFHLLRVEKQFGEQSKMVWEVKLGGVE